MNRDQVAELLQTLGELREAVRDLRRDLLATRRRLRVLEFVAVFAAGAVLAELAPTLIKLLA